MKIKQSKVGRGVFATKSYLKGELVEVSPIIRLNKEDTLKIDDTDLYNYYYSWGNENDQAAIALGYGSLFNHSYSPNMKYIKQITKKEIHFIALRNIEKSEQLLINYNGDPSSKKKLWFDQVDLAK